MTVATTSTDPILVETEADAWALIRSHVADLVGEDRVTATEWFDEFDPYLTTPLPLPALYSRAKVERVVNALLRLEQIVGDWAGEPLRLFDWQVCYEIGPVFGLLNPATGRRIIRTAWFEKPRKNGKSTECSGLAIYLAFADGEEGAQVYTAAKNKAQAQLVFEPAKVMAERCPQLRERLGARGITKGYLHNPSTMSILKPLAADMGGNLHGLNVHGGIIDEVHVHGHPDTVDALETGTGSRSQPLVIFITTADEGVTGSVYDTKRTYVENLHSRTIVDPSFYGVVFAAPDAMVDADPFGVDTQRAANPGYGLTVTAEYLQKAATTASNSAAELNRYLRLHLGRRTKQSIAWLTMPQWDAAGGMVAHEDFNDRITYLGYDLSATTDFTAAVWLSALDSDEDDDGDPIENGYLVWAMFWIPEDRVDALERMTGVPLRRWIKEGWIRATEGNVVDYRKFRADVEAITEQLDCRIAEVAYDPWNATETALEMQNLGHTMVQTRQGYMSLNAPSKEVERMVMGSTPERPLLRHGGNPVLRWMADCAEVMQDPAGNIKPVKPDRRKSAKRIDGMAALVNAMSRAMLRTPPKKKRRAGGTA